MADNFNSSIDNLILIGVFSKLQTPPEIMRNLLISGENKLYKIVEITI